MNILSITDFCTEPGILKIMLFIEKLVNIIFIIVPIGLIIMLAIDFSKNVINSDDGDVKKNNKTILGRIISTLLLFLVPTFINIVMSIINDAFGSSINYNSCSENIKNISYYEKLKEKEKEREQAEKDKELQKNIAKAKELQAIKKLSISLTPNNPSYKPSGATFVGQRYNLTDDELTQIAALCQQEQSSPEGSAAEASLMANKYELSRGNTGDDGHKLYNYIYGNGWWANSAYFMDKRKVNSENKAAVKEVLVLGNRTLPHYIDEHDCFSDINTIITNGKTMTDQSSISNHSNYTSNETEIHNNMHSIYTFYTFPSEHSDPFGYTSHALKQFESLNSKNNRYTE